MKKTILTIITAVMISLSFLPQFSVAHAQQTDLSDETFNLNELSLGGNEQPNSYFDSGQYSSPIVAFIARVINFAVAIIGSIAVILFIAGGFMYMFSGGQQQNLDNAKDVLKYATIGIVVALLAYLIVISVQSIFINQ